MGIKENYDFELLENEAEKMVLKELDTLLNSEEYDDICKCQDCVLDMAAYTLNNIKPLYRVSLMGTLYAHSVGGTDYEQEVRDTVLKAVKKISKNPSH